jgi:hypothetical protein
MKKRFNAEAQRTRRGAEEFSLARLAFRRGCLVRQNVSLGLNFNDQYFTADLHRSAFLCVLCASAFYFLSL